MARRGDPLDYYHRLGVHPTATADEIGAAFKERAKALHPDSARGADDDAFQALAEAYEVLKNPQKRLEYDAIAAQESERAHARARPGDDAGGGVEEDADRSRRRRAKAKRERRLRRASARGGFDAGAWTRRLLIGGLLATTAAALVGVWLLRGEIERRNKQIVGLTEQVNVALDEAARESVRRRALQYRRARGARDDDALGVVYETAIDFGGEGVALEGPVLERFHAARADIEAAIEAMPRDAEWLLALEALGQTTDRVEDDEVIWRAAARRLTETRAAFVEVGFDPTRIAERIALGFGGDLGDAPRVGVVEARLVCCLDGSTSSTLARYRAESVIEQRAARAREIGEGGGPDGPLSGVVPAIFPPALFEEDSHWPSSEAAARSGG